MKAGFKSSGQLKLVTDGKRNLGKSGIYNVCKGLGLAKKDARFFESLVCFNQAEKHEEKDHYYRQILDCYPAKHAKVIDAKCYKALGHWQHVAILELIRLNSFKPDAGWISKKLKPNVSVQLVKNAVKDLELAGLIKRNQEGKIERADKMIATPDEVNSIAITNLHEQLIGLSVKSLKEDPLADKEYSALIVSLSANKLKKLKQMIVEFRKEAHSLLESQDLGDEKTDVVCLGTQLFKLTNGGVI